MTDSAFDLLPCPFCAGTSGVAVSSPSSRWAGFWVRCYADKGGCGAQGPQKRQALAAIESWNRRAAR